jgi:lipopolysaccharide transport system permease protein
LEYEIKPVSKFSINAKEIWSYKELFYYFTWRDIKVKYKQTVLGMAWAILQPTVMMLVFTFLFGKLIQTNERSALPYAVYVYSGLMLWGIFSNGIQTAGNSMVTNANIIKKIYFPRLIIPLSSILVAIFDFIMTLIPFVLLLFYYKIEIDAIRLVTLLPLSLFIIVLTTVGTGCFLSALNVKYRDFRFVIPFLVQFSLYTSPIIYKLDSISNTTIKFFLSINPISVAIDIYRSAFDPTAIIDYAFVSIGTGIAFTLFAIGIYYFRKTESYFADLA